MGSRHFVTLKKMTRESTKVNMKAVKVTREEWKEQQKNRAKKALLVKEVAGAEALRSFFSTGKGRLNRKILDPRYLILSYLTYLTIVSYNLILY